MVDRRVVGVFVREFGSPRAARQRRHADGGGAGADEASARDPGHWRSPPGDCCLPAIIPRDAGLGKDDGGPGNADITLMRWQWAFVVLTGLVAAGCDVPDRPPPPYFVIPPGPLTQPAATAPAEGSPSRTPLVMPNPEVQRFLPPSSPDEFMRGPPPVPEPGRSAGPFYTPPYSGPITGYGPGGMAQPPGAPPNPPYPPGGLMH